jgi:hypothetical protein
LERDYTETGKVIWHVSRAQSARSPVHAFHCKNISG